MEGNHSSIKMANLQASFPSPSAPYPLCCPATSTVHLARSPHQPSLLRVPGACSAPRPSRTSQEPGASVSTHYTPPSVRCGNPRPEGVAVPRLQRVASCFSSSELPCSGGLRRTTSCSICSTEPLLQHSGIFIDISSSSPFCLPLTLGLASKRFAIKFATPDQAARCSGALVYVISLKVDAEILALPGCSSVLELCTGARLAYRRDHAEATGSYTLQSAEEPRSTEC